jgi:hypothetical protein
MKKIYIIAIALLLVGSYSAQAQLKLGIKGGVNFSKITSSDPSAQLDNLTAWHGGLMAEIKMPIIGIELDALYTQNGTKVDAGGVVEDLKNTYIALPLLVKVYFLKVINIHAGPQFSFLTSSKLGDLDWKDQLQSNDLQIVFGAGVELAMLHASLRYHLGVKDINASTVSTFDLKNNAVMLSVGIWLKK